MICLGIESTAHTLGIGVAKRDGGKFSITSNALDMYRSLGEGMIPRKAADHHEQVFATVLEQSLEKARIGLSEVDLFAFSAGPGIGQCLRVSCAAAKYLSLKFAKPVIGVNHAHAHLAVSKWHCGFSDPLYVYVSGGNTQIIVEQGSGKNISYVVVGETLDIGLGNLFDNFGRAMKLEHAHGAAVSQAAQGGKYVELPYTVKGTNMAFSGLLTYAEKALEKHSKQDVAYSVLETGFAIVCEAAERCMYLAKKNEITVCGGVAQNPRLCSMLDTMAQQNGWKFGVAPGEYNRDNGAMIALTGLINYSEGQRTEIKDARPNQNWRVDQV